MLTASWFTYTDGNNRVSISLGTPRYAKRGWKKFPLLMPRREMLGWDHDRYRYEFFDSILGPLDPQQVWDDLHSLVGDGEQEPVLLCFEKPPFHERNFCHRRMVAEWFQDKLGVNVPEYEKPTDQGFLFPPSASI